MRIFVRTLDCSRIITLVGVQSSTTIASLKDKIQQEEKILADQQCLIFAGQQVHDDYTLAYYNIREEFTLVLDLLKNGTCGFLTRDFKCDICGQKFWSILGLGGHEMAVHEVGLGDPVTVSESHWYPDLVSESDQED